MNFFLLRQVANKLLYEREEVLFKGGSISGRSWSPDKLEKSPKVRGEQYFVPAPKKKAMERGEQLKLSDLGWVIKGRGIAVAQLKRNKDM